MKDVIIINPPMVQLNTPYPSGAYLGSFFKSQGCNTRWYDLNIDLFYSIFSSSGLKRLFELTEKKALKMAEKAENQGDSSTGFNLRRYISTKDLWINWIDFITQTLCDGNTSTREKQHQFLYSPFVPRGNRMVNFLANLPDAPHTDHVRFLCSYALADLADYITAVFDPQFSLIRYAEEVCFETPDLDKIIPQLDSPVMKEFYQPVLEKYFGVTLMEGESLPLVLSTASAVSSRRGEGGESLPLAPACPRQSSATPSSGERPATPPESSQAGRGQTWEKTLLCISVPFAGTFVPALVTARYFKQQLGDSVYVCIGGGYVNTELRNFTDKRLAQFVDAISFDRGYGSYVELGKSSVLSHQSSEDFSSESNKSTVIASEGWQFSIKGEVQPIYKLRQFIKSGKSVKVIEPVWENAEIQKYEDEITRSVIPDFSDIDFSRYPRVCDDKNPMHRLWSDGAWIKAFISHGCYWHKCAFCDTKLDYVCAYKPVDVKKLYEGLLHTAHTKGVYGIHFVDEALPPVLIKYFALENARHGNPLYYWGNIRFEKSFTKDLAALLSYCGLGGVSAGIESATGTGLENINKGTDIGSIINACAAFKEAGILVHAYMIYGFWNDTPQTIIDSMETLRQFFAAGLLDSSFWHKFMLTKNSTLFDKLKDTWNGGPEFAKFGPGLDSAVQAWMHGEKLETKVQKWFDFQVPSPTIPKDFVDRQIEKYERKSSQFGVAGLSHQSSVVSHQKMGGDIYWLGSNPVVCGNELCWIYLQEELSVSNAELRIKNVELIELLENLRPECSEKVHNKAMEKVLGDETILKTLKKLHNQGIVVV